MAQIVPDCLPRNASAGERRLFSVLRRLPEDCVVYYEPMVGDRCPDFVVICPELGLLVIEVKGWRARDILGADNHGVQVAQHGRPVRQEHPLRQARSYMFALMDRCRAHPAIGPLLRPEGHAHQNRFLFPFGYFAVLSNLTEAQLKGHPAGDLTTVFPAHRVLPRDALLALEACGSAEALHETLRGCFVKSWPFPRLSGEQVDALRAIIHPEIILELPLDFSDMPAPTAATSPTPPPTTAAPAAAARSPRHPPSLRVLDLQQESHARAIGEGHRILSGVAGSGKTVILLARARLRAARAPDARLLVLCYNVSLASFLRSALAGCPNVAVHHFEGWAAANGVRRDYEAKESDQSLGARFLAALAKGIALDAHRFESVLVDEVQDFEAVWLKCVLAAMHDPRDGDLLLVGDGNQGVYPRRGKLNWSALGIQARGRTISARFGLEINYRNSREIARLAQQFADDGEKAGKDVGADHHDGIGALRLDAAKSPRVTGLHPVLVSAQDRAGECARAAVLVSDLLAGRPWPGRIREGKEEQALAPSEIAVLYRRLAKADEPLFRRFLADLGKLAPVVWLNRRDDPKARLRVQEFGVKVQTIHSAKGLQYRAVILLWAGDLPYRPGNGNRTNADDLTAERRLFYVGLTRAEDYLALTTPTHKEAQTFIGQVEATADWLTRC